MALLRFCQTMLRRQRQETAGTLLERKRYPIELLANGPRLRALDNQIFSRETSRNLEKPRETSRILENPRESSRILENPREIWPRVLRVGRQAAVAHHLALFLVFFFASITRTSLTPRRLQEWNVPPEFWKTLDQAHEDRSELFHNSLSGTARADQAQAASSSDALARHKVG